MPCARVFCRARGPQLANSEHNSDQVKTSVESGPPADASDQKDRGYKPLLQDGAAGQEAAGTRRQFLGRSAKKLAYISPVVLLLRPRPACASRIYS